MDQADFTFAHLGIHHETATEASDAAEIFSRLFGFPEKDSNSSIFAGPSLEMTKSKFPGERGHIGIGTSDVSSSVEWLAAKVSGLLKAQKIQERLPYCSLPRPYNIGFCHSSGP